MMEKLSKDKNIPSALIGGILLLIIFDLIWLWYSGLEQSQISCKEVNCKEQKSGFVPSRNTKARLGTKPDFV